MLQFDFSCKYSLEEVIKLPELIKIQIMSHYNLRNLKRRRNVNEFLRDKSLSPKVKLERLEVLENPKNWNSKFCVRNDKILLKKISFINLFKVKYFIIFFGAFLIFAPPIFFKDNTFDTVVKVSKHYHSFQLNLKKLITSDFNKFLNKKSEHNEKQKTICVYKNNITDFLKSNSRNKSDCKLKELINTEILDLLNEISVAKETSESFIKEECKKELQPDIFNSINTDSQIDSLIDSSVLVDYALQSRGAQVLSVYDTEPYGDVTLKYLDFIMNNFFVHKLFNSNGPTAVLVPWRKPGDCWAFKGSTGRILIKLSHKIVITAISIDHIFKGLTEGRSIESAPKNFSVMGVIEDLDDSQRTIPLGSFQYNISGPNLQTFHINSNLKNYYRLVEFKFYSNHGNKNYTCIYKIRVHGYP